MSKPKLLDEVRNAARLKQLSLSTEKSYIYYIRRFILFHGKRHPLEIGVMEIRAFLTYLAVNEHVAASTQNIAFSALLFLCRDVLKQRLPQIEGVERARCPTRLPVVFTRAEVRAILAHLSGTPLLVVSLLYGSGLRLMEALRLRVGDVDFAMKQVVVREGKGQKSRVTMLSESVREDLRRHITRVKLLHEEDCSAGYGEVYLPYALNRKYPNKNCQGIKMFAQL